MAAEHMAGLWRYAELAAGPLASRGSAFTLIARSCGAAKFSCEVGPLIACGSVSGLPGAIFRIFLMAGFPANIPLHLRMGGRLATSVQVHNDSAISFIPHLGLLTRPEPPQRSPDIISKASSFACDVHGAFFIEVSLDGTYWLSPCLNTRSGIQLTYQHLPVISALAPTLIIPKEDVQLNISGSLGFAGEVVSLQAAPLHPLPSKIRSLFQAEAELVAMGPTFVAQPHLEEVRLVFLADGSKMSLLENETSPVTALAASRDLILVARDTSAIYDSSGRFMANIPFAGSAAALAHGPELLWAVLGTEREVQVWQLRGLEENSDAESNWTDTSDSDVSDPPNFTVEFYASFQVNGTAGLRMAAQQEVLGILGADGLMQIWSLQGAAPRRLVSPALKAKLLLWALPTARNREVLPESRSGQRTIEETVEASGLQPWRVSALREQSLEARVDGSLRKPRVAVINARLYACLLASEENAEAYGSLTSSAFERTLRRCEELCYELNSAEQLLFKRPAL
ncbi:unnamed protein product [Effrenium voratum]|uniref:Uncharacterized protein n=1 Tax=Effrenium voratum TaxID=2562239 RepID=A0AA36MZA6_9DINO|nr:unnamed protein product [Effrenium voratum]